MFTVFATIERILYHLSPRTLNVTKRYYKVIRLFELRESNKVL